ncbi:hypothetical protein F4861DRAFT_537217 [Xylaria intraflava]|nr:hypothetical protein F4861DRAFT_537217 [Xylaria intraflava]
MPQPTKARDAPDDEPLFFFMPDGPWGEFYQWYRSTFVVSRSEIAALVGSWLSDDDGDCYDDSGAITFTCAEQFMMYRKAARFRDRDTQRRVLAADSPMEQKCLGKLTAGFTDALAGTR